MEQKLEVVLNYISQNPTEIYVWVYLGEYEQGIKTNRSIKVGYEEAVEWCKGVARDNGGTVPAFFSNKTVFLGRYPNL